MKKYTRDDFIHLAKEKFGDLFSYDKTVYVNTKRKVTITCPVHGDFQIRPYDFLRSKFGCPKCADYNNGKAKAHTKEWFINESKKIHGDKYDYSKVDYVNNSTNVCIVCPEHGEFWQIPFNHIHGAGCPLCGKRRKVYTRDEFIEVAEKIHGDKYDYSKVDYVNNKTKVCIICPEHGEFWQKPINHIIQKQSCPVCGREKMSKTNTCSTENFIKKAKLVHGDKYDYSKTKYFGIKEKICIICPEHGEFWQTANTHLNGCGCPMCRKWKLEEEISKFLIEKNITYIFQKRFSWLKNQSLDFYLPDFKVAIECQGIQHFTGWNKEKKSFDIIHSLDVKKQDICLKNDIRILYYTNYDLCYEFTDIYNKENTFLEKEQLIENIMTE